MFRRSLLGVVILLVAGSAFAVDQWDAHIGSSKVRVESKDCYSVSQAFTQSQMKTTTVVDLPHPTGSADWIETDGVCLQMRHAQYASTGLVSSTTLIALPVTYFAVTTPTVDDRPFMDQIDPGQGALIAAAVMGLWAFALAIRSIVRVL